MGGGYIGEYLRVRVFGEACCITHHLGKLTPGNLVIGAERAVCVAGDYTTAGKAAYRCIEGVILVYVDELYGARGSCGRGCGVGRSRY